MAEKNKIKTGNSQKQMGNSETEKQSKLYVCTNKKPTEMEEEEIENQEEQLETEQAEQETAENSEEQENGTEENAEEQQTEEGEQGEEQQAEQQTEISEADQQAYNLLKELNEEYDGNTEGSMQKLMEDYRQLREQNAQYAMDSKAIADALDTDPEMADVFTAVADGIPFKVAIATYMDLENIKPMEGDADYERYVEEREKLKASREQQKKDALQWESNKAETVKVSKDFFAEKEMSEKEQQSFVDFFDKIIDDISQSKVSRDTLERIYNAYTYKDAVAGARKQGEVAGRNQKIEQKRATRANGSDGLPGSGTSVQQKPAENGQKSQIFGWLGEESEYYNGRG